MTRPQARKRIRALAEQSENVTLRIRHVKKRMRERGIDLEEILNVLRKGEIVEGPYLDEKGCWRCRVERLAAGEEITVVVAICGAELVVITVF